MWTPTYPPRKRVRHHDDGQAHFLTFSCYRRLPLLSKDRTREWFVEAVEAARTQHEFHLWGWVIMPEHVHLLLCPQRRTDPQGSRIGRIDEILTTIKSSVASKAIRFLKRSAPEFLKRLTVVNARRVYRHFWQPGPGFDENISHAGALRSVIDYIHLNPVRRGLVTNPTDWLWSSARDWAGLPWDGIRVNRTLPETFVIPWISDRSRI